MISASAHLPDPEFVYTIMYAYSVFTWDEEKAKTNLRVHGIAFETAREAFGDPFQVTIENYRLEDENEQRFAMIGMSDSMTLLFVVFGDRSNVDTEILHIISARKAERYEQKIYAAHLENQNY